MEFKSYINSRQKQENRIQNIMHIIIFLTDLILIMIVLISRPGCWSVIIILILLMLTNVFVWFTRRNSRIRIEKMFMQSRIDLDVIDLPKVYDFYCPKCLYQTNEQVEYCPNCQTRKLSPTTQHLD